VCGDCFQYPRGNHRHNEGVSRGEEESRLFRLRPRLKAVQLGSMRFLSRFRGALVALLILTSAGISSVAHADSGTIWIWELKGGWFIGGSAGAGTLLFHGRNYPLSIGGVSAGLVFGGSETTLYGYVTNIRSPSPAFMGASAPALRSWSARERSCCATKRVPCLGCPADRSD
jgi:hypothetical protein